MESHQHQSTPKKTEAPSPAEENKSEAPVSAGLLFKMWEDPRLPAVQRQKAVMQIGSLVGNRAMQKMLQRRRTRHPGVLDNGILNRNVPVVLGNLSGILPRGTYVEVIARNGENLRVKVWSGYSGQETDIPAAAFEHEAQRHDHLMDRVDMGIFASIPADQRLPLMPGASFSDDPEAHAGVLNNGRVGDYVYTTLQGRSGVLPAGTYIEIISVEADGARIVRVWSGYSGQEARIRFWEPARFHQEQVADNLMDVPDLEAYARVPLHERLPLGDSVRLRVIDNGVITREVATLEPTYPTLMAGMYVEVMEYRGDVAVIRPHSGAQMILDAAHRFIRVNRSDFTAAFRHQPQVGDELDRSGETVTGSVRQDVMYGRRTEPLWGRSGPQLEDIAQGEVGTCGVLAAAGALLRQDPSIIRDNVFRGNAPDAETFQVHLYPNAANGANGSASVYLAQRVVTVDRYLPAQTMTAAGDDPALYASGRRALWPAVLEKAFAEVFRGYDDLDAGEQEQQVMRVLTGDVVGTRTLRPGSLSEADLLSQLQALEAARSAVTFSTDVISDDLSEDLGLIGEHAYTFTMMVDNEAQLYNPWGSDQPPPLSMAQIRQYVDNITIRD